MNDGIVMPEFPGAPPIEEQRAGLINEISGIASKLDVMWQFHPSNPKGKDLREEYKILQEWLQSSKEAFDALGK